MPEPRTVRGRHYVEIEVEYDSARCRRSGLTGADLVSFVDNKLVESPAHPLQWYAVRAVTIWGSLADLMADQRNVAGGTNFNFVPLPPPSCVGKE